jgi:hypothetical protein
VQPVHNKGLLESQDAPQLEAHWTHFPVFEINTKPKLHYLQTEFWQEIQLDPQRAASKHTPLSRTNPLLHDVQAIADVQEVQFIEH